jgi:hypothetical protein
LDFGQPLQMLEGAPPTFIGHAPASNELEVITWNPAARRYDFLLVTDYKQGGTPKVQNADTSVCLACHQHGGPIFPRNGWSEAGINTTNDFVQKIELGPKVPGIPLHGIDNAELIDSLVRAANDTLQANRACMSGCGNDLKCREALLLGTVARPYLATNAVEKRKLAQTIANQAQSTWPKDEFTYPSDVLPNRDPAEDPEHHGTVTHVQIKDLQKFEQFFGLAAPSNDIVRLEKYRIEQEHRENIDFTYNHDQPQADFGMDSTNTPYDDPSSLGDPTVKRPKVAAIPSSLAGEYLLDHVTDCFNLSNSDEALLKKIPYAKMERILSDKTTDEFVSSWPVNRDRIMAYIQDRIAGSKIPQNVLCPVQSTAPLDESQQNSMNAMSGILQKVPPKNAVEVFKVYCGKCHDGPNASVEDFKINSVEDLRNFQPMSGISIMTRIQNGVMPADLDTYSDERKKEWDRDKQMILKELQQ